MFQSLALCFFLDFCVLPCFSLKDLANMPSIEHLPSGGTRVIYNGKIFDLQGRVIRADELGDVSMLNRDQWVKKYGFRLKPHNRVLNFFRAFFRFN